MNQHPRNQILNAVARSLEPLKTNGEVKSISVSLTSSKDDAPFILLRSAAEQVEQVDSTYYQRELIILISITVHADDDAVNLLDKLAAQVEALAPAADIPFELLHPGLALAETQFPDLPGDELAAAVLAYRITYHTLAKEE